MPPLAAKLAYWEGLILIGGLFAVIFWKLMTGEISLDGMFDGDIRDPASEDGVSPYTSMGRVQVFWVTLYVAYYYLMQIIRNPTEFPAVPDSMLAVLAGSHAMYLGGKAQAMLLGRLKDFLK